MINRHNADPNATDEQFLHARIHVTAIDLAEDYPNIENVECLEQFWAIEQGYRGTQQAIKDWQDFTEFLISELGWTPLKAIEYWENKKRAEYNKEQYTPNEKCGRKCEECQMYDVTCNQATYTQVQYNEIDDEADRLEKEEDEMLEILERRSTARLE